MRIHPTRNPAPPSALRFARLLLVGLPLVWACAGEIPVPPEPTDLAALAGKAAAAYEEHDYAAFLAHTEAALEVVPGHPRLLYNLACGHALLGEPAPAFIALERLASQAVYFDLEADTDLASLRGEPAYADLRARFESLWEPVIRSREAFRLERADFIPEGVAHDPVSGDFFVSSVRYGEIVRVRRNTDGGTEIETVAGPEQGLGAVLGMAVDAQRRLLWAITLTVPHLHPDLPRPRLANALVRLSLEDPPEGDSAAVAAAAGPDAGGGATQFFAPRLVAPPEGTGEAFNDLAVGPDGTVVVGDSRAGALFRLAPGAESLEVLLPPGTFRSPQGLTFDADGSKLWLADYSRGLVRVDLATREVQPVPSPPDASLLGIDGLARVEDRPGPVLIAVQNGVRPHRVLRITLSEDGPAVTGVEILEKNHPDHQEPTLGVMVGSDFFYVANGQLNLFDAEGHLPEDAEPAAPVILRLPV